ncbi:LytR family transcriptional regulator [Amnibacterium flavum]|uniref:LytR family transcriptional regulator n=2 Tax=Amnibacterium flavum TaxID=2173173 RepID=A0A2V1HUV9_9MICO|nr:LCP family protein [Amnibacterium flavum]PVZ96373.1 LytR family transcriptional regulator [Amnibacterium flavum]
MTRRAWFLVVLNLLIPGSAQALAGSRKLGRFGLRATLSLWLLVGIAVVVYLLWPVVVFSVATNPIGLWVAQVLLVAYAILWIVLTFDTLRLVKLVRIKGSMRPAVAAFSIVTLVVLTGTAAYGAVVAGTTRDTIGNVFASAPPEPPINGRYNILLLGGDAGPDRDGLRPDSVSVISIEDATGKVSMFGLPRDLTSIPFSADSPMLANYPNGYGYNDTCDVDVCMLNSIYTEVELKSPDLYPNAVAEGSEPGIEAMRDAVEGALGIQIQYYVLIDMYGFEQLINALGGITIDVKERLPIGGSEDLSDVGAWIEPGVQHMDGNTALWYARSRHGTSDYDRMSRQREVQEAMIQQMDPSNVLARFQDVAAAGSEVVKTDIPQGTLGRFVELALLAKGQPITNVDFVPPLIDPEAPDYSLIQQMTADAMALTPAEGD